MAERSTIALAPNTHGSMAATPDEDHMPELVISSLPLETRCPPIPLRQYRGFWLPEPFLPGIIATRARFKPRPSDVVLASFPKSGTTWLKALAFATVHRSDHPPRDADHPLRLRNPHDCVDFLELAFARSAADGEEDVFAELPSPQVIATHIPYPLLPARVAAEDASGGRIVYICRDPKDALVSMWLFTKKLADIAAEANGGNKSPKPYAIEEALELFCDGRYQCAPHWHHVVGYWEASQKLPGKVLFLRYEEMLRDPVGNVMKLAEFMGCAFSSEEAAAGVVEDIVELCSIDALRNMEVNKNGGQKHVKNETYFRKGVVGDWSNHMTPAMAERVDKIVEDALQGTGFTFAVTESA